MNTKEILRRIEQAGERITSQIISDLIAGNETTRQRQIRDYEHYKAENLPIQERAFSDPTKINRKVNNDFRGEIVDQAVGYLFGKPITYSIDKEYYGDDEASFERDREVLDDFKKENRLEDIDLEAGKKQGVCGSAGRIMYIDTEGKVRAMNVPPWEMIYIQDRSLDRLQYAMRYYYVDEVEGDQKTKKTRVEWYDSENVWFFISNGKDFVLDKTEPVNPMPHQFEEVPVVEIPNNDERMSDFKKVKALIKAYDNTISDAQNEIEEFRQAYMMFKGASIDAETIEEARQSGAFDLPADADASFLIKQINDRFLENHKDTLRDNIYRFGKTVDITSDTFTGQGASGEARKWVLTALEWRCGIKALKFKMAIQSMFRIAQGAWERLGITIDWKKVNIHFDRNIPEELMLEAQIQEKLNGLVSDRKRLEIFGPVRDVDSELAQMEAERGDMVDLDEVPDEDEVQE